MTRPYEELLTETFQLPVPKVFQRFFPRVLNCGKSIEVLAILQKQGRLSSLPLKSTTEARLLSLAQKYRKALCFQLRGC